MPIEDMKVKVDELQGFIDALTVKETAEEKALREAISLVDGELKAQLRGRLTELQAGKASDVNSILELVDVSGYDLATVVRNGFSKIRGSLRNRMRIAQSTYEEKVGEI